MKGDALRGFGDFEGAHAAYTEGLTVEPGGQRLIDGMLAVEALVRDWAFDTWEPPKTHLDLATSWSQSYLPGLYFGPESAGDRPRLVPPKMVLTARIRELHICIRCAVAVRLGPWVKGTEGETLFPHSRSCDKAQRDPLIHIAESPMTQHFGHHGALSIGADCADCGRARGTEFGE